MIKSGLRASLDPFIHSHLLIGNHFQPRDNLSSSFVCVPTTCADEVHLSPVDFMTAIVLVEQLRRLISHGEMYGFAFSQPIFFIDMAVREFKPHSDPRETT
jgi:hypothetical protein